MSDLVQIGFRVPQPLLKEAEDMAKAFGLSKANLNRDIWITGLQTYAERMNKVMVNKGLREKHYAD